MLEMREKVRWVRDKGVNERMNLRDAEAILKVEEGYGRREEKNEKANRRRYRKKEYCHLRR